MTTMPEGKYLLLIFFSGKARNAGIRRMHLDPEAKKILEESLALDIELYNFINTRLTEQMKKLGL